MSKHMIDDAKRCLQCRTAPCVKGCPVNTPIPQVISLLLDNNIIEAGHLLFNNNPLSLVCSYICPQENQCEGHCVLGKKNKGLAVQISAIEQYISDYYLNIYTPQVSAKNRGNVAIIGSGPAGITIAFLLAARNYNVTIFEGHNQIGGILRYGIPEFRLPKTILDRLKEKLLAVGVKIRPNTTIGANLEIDELFRDGFQAIFVGTGVWQPNKMGIKGESLGHVHYAIEYLRSPEAYNLGKRVAVIGAGNVAMDVARTALRNGSREVHIMYTKDKASMTAREVEVEFAKIDGAVFEFNKIAVEFVEDGVIFADSAVNVDEAGYKRAMPIAGTEQLFHADSAIIAISQGPRDVIVSTTKGLNTRPNGLMVTDECGHTAREGIFASGDVVTGAKTVVEAVKMSFRVADAIDIYINHEG